MKTLILETATSRQTHLAHLSGTASLKSFKTLADSPSKIVLTREQFERDSVKNLIEVAGGSSVIEFVNSLPWTSLRMQDNAIELTNTSEASIEANGMILSTEANSSY